jgi:peptidoglycan hydrolase-like protein with peptidoglycan-binding domain
MNDPIKLTADFDDQGRLIIERMDGKEISIITHEELSEDCVDVLEINSTGHAVKALQCLLNAHDQHLDEDGIFGEMTQTALIIYQDQHHLPATGTCDLLTWEQLIRS